MDEKKKPLFTVDYSKTEIPFEFRVKQRDCKCESNLDFLNELTIAENGMKTFTTHVICLDCMKQTRYSLNIDKLEGRLT